MGFLSPLLLFALLAVLLPLLIHLIRFRTVRTVRFSSLAFLNELAQGAIRRIRLKRSLLLLIRMLAIVLLALSLARPVLHSLQNAEERGDLLVLLIDNSPGMNQSDRDGRHFDQALGAAMLMADGLPASSRVLLEVTHGAALGLPLLSPEETRRRLQQLEVSNSGNHLGERLDQLGQRVAAYESTPLFRFVTVGNASLLVTGFVNETGSSGPGPFPWPLQILRVGGEEETMEPNVAITEWSSEWDRDGGGLRLRAEVSNTGMADVRNHELGLELAGEIRSSYLLDLDSGESETFTFEWVPERPEEYLAVIVLEGDDLLFDNRRYVAFNPEERRSFLLLTGGSEQGSHWLRSALQVIAEARDGLELEVLAPDGPEWERRLLSAGEAPAAIVLDGVETMSADQENLLVDYVDQGGHLLLLPSREREPTRLGRLSERFGLGRIGSVAGRYGSARAIGSTAEIRRGHPLFEGVFDLPDAAALRIDRPEVYSYVRLTPADPASLLNLLEMENGDPLMVRSRADRGVVILSTVGLDPGWSDFPLKPLFVPFMDRLIQDLTGLQQQALEEHLIGEPFDRVLPGRVTEMELLPMGIRLIPEQRQVFGGALVRDPARDWTPGWLRARMGKDSLVIAVNLHTMESDLRTLEDRELESGLSRWFEEVVVQSATERFEMGWSRGHRALETGELWHWFLFLAIVLLLIESVTARLFKAETNYL